MLGFEPHKDFKKEYKKLPGKAREAFKERISLFTQDPHNALLRNHALQGRLKGRYAFSVMGDIRVVYTYLDKNTVLLLRIGTHNQVY